MWSPNVPSHLHRTPPTPSSATPQPKKKHRVQEDESIDVGRGQKLQFSDEEGVPGGQLTSDQSQVLAHASAGHSIFFSGSAGTGKTFLLKRIVAELRANGLQVAVTASTGIAATHLQGCTIHSFAGIGTGEGSKEKLLKWALMREAKTKQGSKGKGVWTATDVLVLDECSMLSAHLFDCLEYCARSIRNNPLPFGGIQVIACGDFLQLPPVARQVNETMDCAQTTRFAFRAMAWDAVFRVQLSLKTVMRQTDPQFASILEKVRRGAVDSHVEKALQACQRPLAPETAAAATRLFTHNADVDATNSAHLKQLRSDSVVFHAVDRLAATANAPATAAAQVARLLAETGAPLQVELKAGAQVILTRNLSDSLANGSRGVVVRFEAVDDDDALVATSSLCRSERQAELRPWLRANRVLPVVRFNCGQELPILPERFIAGDFAAASHNPSAVRLQVPLRLGLALTIHKCQGMTLDCVHISLRGVFEAGQAYVALSRGRSLDGLRIDGFDASKVIVDPEALAFHTRLEETPTIDVTCVTASWISRDQAPVLTGEDRIGWRTAERAAQREGRRLEEALLSRLEEQRRAKAQDRAQSRHARVGEAVEMETQRLLACDECPSLADVLRGTAVASVTTGVGGFSNLEKSATCGAAGSVVALLDKMVHPVPQRNRQSKSMAVPVVTTPMPPLPGPDPQQATAAKPQPCVVTFDEEEQGRQYTAAARQRYREMRWRLRQCEGGSPLTFDTDENGGDALLRGSGAAAQHCAKGPIGMGACQQAPRRPLSAVNGALHAHACAMVKANTVANCEAAACPAFAQQPGDPKSRPAPPQRLFPQGNRQVMALFHRLEAVPGHRRP